MTIPSGTPSEAVATAYVGLGANLGDARETLRQALIVMRSITGTSVEAVSSFYGSEPVEAGGPPFVNAVAALRTSQPPFALLKHLRAIERKFGRRRPYVNAPRTLDLDLLTYGNMRLDTPLLALPHPRMHQRAFVLLPLVEIAPELVVPGLGGVADLVSRDEVSQQAVWKLADQPITP